jgi:hypothetical protein
VIKMAYTLNGVSLGTVVRETVREYTNPTALPIPTTSSNNTEVYCYEGVTREITAEGVLTMDPGETISNLYTKVRNIGNVCNNITGGTQQTAKVNYVSDLIGTVGVYVDSFDFSYAAGDGNPTIVRYSLRLVEGAT